MSYEYKADGTQAPPSEKEEEASRKPYKEWEAGQKEPGEHREKETDG